MMLMFPAAIPNVYRNKKFLLVYFIMRMSYRQESRLNKVGQAKGRAVLMRI